MANLTQAEIAAHLAGLVAPPGGLGELHHLAERLCSVQQTLKPVTTPRRLVLFAADHGPDAESRVGDTIHAVASGGSPSAVLAKTTTTDLVLVDVGSRTDPLSESPRYRCRKVRPGSRDFTRQPALTADEFRAAFVVGQQEAEQAHADGMRVVAADACAGERQRGRRGARTRGGERSARRRPDERVRGGRRGRHRRARGVRREGHRTRADGGC